MKKIATIGFFFLLVACSSSKVNNGVKGKEAGKNSVKNENSGKLKRKVPVYVTVKSNFVPDSIKFIIKHKTDLVLEIKLL